MGLRPTQGDENGFCSATALHGSVALPFVIPPVPVCRGTGVFMGLQPTQGDENGFCLATALYGSVALPFVIPRPERSMGLWPTQGG
jgi:hypothetical protein